MWLFLLYNKKASIEVLLLCSSLLLVRFLYPYEFPFTHTVYITKGYPTLNEFFNQTLSIGRIKFPVAALLDRRKPLERFPFPAPLYSSAKIGLPAFGLLR